MSRRVEDIAADVSSQLKEEMQLCEYFSLQFDESCDATDTDHVAVLLGWFFRNFLLKKSF